VQCTHDLCRKIHADGSAVTKNQPPWAAPGDVNAFFGLMLDNIADLLLTVGLLAGVFHFPTTFALQYMVPGTAIGVLFGDLMFFFMALALARRTGRDDVTAMPLGLDTPSTIAMVLFVLGPSFLYAQQQLGYDEGRAAEYTWHIGICSIFLSGIFKVGCAFVSGMVRRLVPRAGLLGSLTAIALVLISFLPLLDVLHYPLVGLVALAIILTTLVARVPLPGRIPGALGALLVAGTIYYVMAWTGLLTPETIQFQPADGLLPTGWLEAFRFEWFEHMRDALHYLPIVIPFALATVVGGIDCTESAAAAGDEYDTRLVIGVEGLATILAAVCGGVIQTTPYIGHPAYKAMGGRSAYTLATAVFVGGAGLLGYFGYLYLVIPKAAIFPILIFIGLEITAQSFHATPARHYAAVALACVPAMAKLVIMFANSLLDQLGRTIDSLAPPLPEQLQTIQILASGFIVTSLLWGSALAALIDRRLRVASAYFAVASVCSLFGVIHSPFPDERLVVPWALADTLPHAAAGQSPVYMATAYLLVAVMLFVWGTHDEHQRIEVP
jgi:AGZA family xanthine/uracil permease-like MFS transporter